TSRASSGDRIAAASARKGLSARFANQLVLAAFRRVPCVFAGSPFVGSLRLACLLWPAPQHDRRTVSAVHAVQAAIFHWRHDRHLRPGADFSVCDIGSPARTAFLEFTGLAQTCAARRWTAYSPGSLFFIGLRPFPACVWSDQRDQPSGKSSDRRSIQVQTNGGSFRRHGGPGGAARGRDRFSRLTLFHCLRK